MSRTVTVSILTAWLLASIAAPAPAQVWAGRGVLEVRVRGEGAGDVAGATVQLRFLDAQPASGPAPAVTDASGRAAVSGLAEGSWLIEVSHPDFLTYVTRVRLTIGQKVDEVQVAQRSDGAGAGILRVRFDKVRRGAPPPPGPTIYPSPPPPAPEVPEAEEPTPEREPEAPRAAPAPLEPEAEATRPETPPQAPVAPVQPEPEPEPPAESEPETPPAPAPREEPSPPAPSQEPVPEPEPAPPASVVEPPVPEPEPEPVPEAGPEQPAATPPPPLVEPPAPEPEPVPAEEPVPPSAPEPLEDAASTPTAPVAAQAAAADRPPARTVRASDGTCPDCRGSESALRVGAAVGPAPRDAGCPANAAAVVEEAAGLLERAIGDRLAGFYGPLVDSELRDLLSLAPPDVRHDVTATLGPLTAEDGACRVLAVLLPNDTELAGFRYEVRDVDGVADCLPGQECPQAAARWPGNPGRIELAGRTLIWTLFLNESPDRQRHPRLTVYLR
jgi:hypothetical protein